jgi:cellobiose phosphorylase
MNPSTPPPPHRLESPSGLRVEVNGNGSLRRIDHGDILLNLFPGNELEGGPANLYLRLLDDGTQAIPLLGPRSPARMAINGNRLTLSGEWQGIRFAVVLALAELAPAWFWHVMLENTGAAPVTVDLIHAQDLGLAHYGAVRLNEYYVSQYVDHAPLAHPTRGWVLASRQNQSMGGRNPWCVIGTLGHGTSFATDALQVHGLATRAGLSPAGVTDGLPGVRRQHEHAMAAIQDKSVRLEPGAATGRGFFGWFEQDHPAASSDADLAFVDRALALPEAAAPAELPSSADARPVCVSLFSTAPLLETLELAEAELDTWFGTERRHAERDADGRLLSFFGGTRRHVVLKAKELQILRPHGHILHSGDGLTPDEAGLTSTVWMAGVFHSMVTQGHVSINRLLSTTHSYLSLFRSHGQRLFVELGGGWRLLDLPSAFEMAPEGCRWIYRYAEGMIEVRSRALTERHELTLEIDVLAGGPLRFLLVNHIALNGDDGSDPGTVEFVREGSGVFIRANPESYAGRHYPDGGFHVTPQPGTFVEGLGGDEFLFAEGASHEQPLLCFEMAPARSLGFSIRGGLGFACKGKTGDSDGRTMTARLRLAPPAESSLAADTKRFADILPWFVHNALVHYLSPRGLEQYSGGGWGARDVTQGPVELLLALGRPELIQDILVRVFRNQNPDGDWPQWFMFFDRVRAIRAGDSHGDIIFWPLLALAQYLLATEDAAFLEEILPFFDPAGDAQAEHATVWEHVERALAVIGARVIAGTRLAAYGHGDWNDSLQPVDPSSRDHLCSAWTVTLHHQTLTVMADALRRLGRDQKAVRFEHAAAEVLADFQRLLVVDGTVAGYAHFGECSRVSYLLHPRDKATGLSYSLLPMVHGIVNSLFTPAQARHHLDLIARHLLGPDGARLFDRPMEYRGGPQRLFQRAESSSFFGREIGLMYTHAHLRYAEALWHSGDAEGFFRALCQAVPIALDTPAPTAARRQANCYYSSSDAAFADRYQAYREYYRVRAGDIPLDGGWRVYSSGAGIASALIFRCFLGLRVEASRVVIDPVIPRDLNGLLAELELAGMPFEITYLIADSGCGVTALELNGRALPFTRRHNPYRNGGAELSLAALRAVAVEADNRMTVRLA